MPGVPRGNQASGSNHGAARSGDFDDDDYFNDVADYHDEIHRRDILEGREQLQISHKDGDDVLGIIRDLR
jgi:hypothetical protein